MHTFKVCLIHLNKLKKVLICKQKNKLIYNIFFECFNVFYEDFLTYIISTTKHNMKHSKVINSSFE